jgi:hypothetical protein
MFLSVPLDNVKCATSLEEREDSVIIRSDHCIIKMRADTEAAWTLDAAFSGTGNIQHLPSSVSLEYGHLSMIRFQWIIDTHDPTCASALVLIQDNNIIILSPEHVGMLAIMLSVNAKAEKSMWSAAGIMKLKQIERTDYDIMRIIDISGQTVSVNVSVLASIEKIWKFISERQTGYVDVQLGVRFGRTPYTVWTPQNSTPIMIGSTHMITNGNIDAESLKEIRHIIYLNPMAVGAMLYALNSKKVFNWFPKREG